MQPHRVGQSAGKHRQMLHGLLVNLNLSLLENNLSVCKYQNQIMKTSTDPTFQNNVKMMVIS